MKVQQLSIFLENRAGRLAEVTELLGKAEINIRALSLADTSDFGILRVVVNKPEKAVRILEENGFTVAGTEVLVVEIDDKPGGLARVLKILNARDINVEYMYAFMEKLTDRALLIFRIEDMEGAIELLRDKGIKILTKKEVSSI
ncbi:MAG: ACT domain-containing protein [Candidatus Euphemobacter frigidus]|nr:ACT domain-containing protein [Candidatus Euphemobacter frigidus]MDP8275689.1 ACT domain-containing protein [Candidatus Euphemobacter frigidus]